MAQNENLIQEIEDVAVRLGKWVTGEFSEANKLYNTLSADEKKAASYAYGVIAIVNQNLDKDGALIIPIIEKAYPDLSLNTLQGFIETLLNDIHAVDGNVPLTLTDALNELAKYLKSLSGHTWGAISQTLGNLITIMFTPETPIQKVAQVAELIYQLFVKPKVAQAA